MRTHPRLRALFALLAVLGLALGVRRLRRRRLHDSSSTSGDTSGAGSTTT